MANLIAIQGIYATDDYRDIKAYGIGGSASNLALAVALQILDSDTGQYVPAETDNFISTSTPSAVVFGTEALSTTQEQLPNHAGKLVMLQNPPSNTINVLIGDSSSQPWVLEPGDVYWAEVANLNALYAKSASGTPSVTWAVYS